jgi:CRP-like cAMP-binding protein
VALPLPHAVELQVHDFAKDSQIPQPTVEALLSGAEGIRVLPEGAIAELASCCDRVIFGAGEQLLAMGEIPRHVYVITAGEALGTQGEETEKTGSIRFGAHEVLGVTSLARAQASDMRVVAVTDVAALRIPSNVVGKALHEHPVLSSQFARIWQARSEVLRRSAQQENEIAPGNAERQGEQVNG